MRTPIGHETLANSSDIPKLIFVFIFGPENSVKIFLEKSVAENLRLPVMFQNHKSAFKRGVRKSEKNEI